jgi:hypothetical protein
MYVCGVDTKELIEQINEKIDRGLAIDRRTLGPLLGLPLDRCYDSVVWKAMERLIWHLDYEQRAQEVNGYPTCDIKEEKETEDHFTYDDVTYPIHYAGNNKITCKDALNSMMCPLEAAITPKIGYWLGCAFKYLWRAFLKGDPKKDLMKCKQCIDEVLNLM